MTAKRPAHEEAPPPSTTPTAPLADNLHVKLAMSARDKAMEAIDQPFRHQEVYLADATIHAMLAVAEEIRELRMLIQRRKP